MRVAVLATGGKDSALALYHVLREGYEVSCLASMIPRKEDSWMFHYPNIRLVGLFARAVNIPLVKAETSGVKEDEVEDLLHLVERLKVEGLVSGAIASEYQKKRVEEVCRRLKLKHIAPLWHRDPLEVLNEMLTLGFTAIMTGVYAYGFDVGWLGRTIDPQTVEEFVRLNERYGVSLVGEGGEYETLVLDGPFFRERIRIVEAEKVWKGQSGYLSISVAKLEPK